MEYPLFTVAETRPFQRKVAQTPDQGLEVSVMSKQAFCATFGIALGTLRHWEQGLRSPRGPARVLLKVVDHDPKAVIHAIND